MTTIAKPGAWAVITGGSRGIGAATARSFARDGVNLVLQYHTGKNEAETIREELSPLGVAIELVEADLTSADTVMQVFADIARRHPVEILVNNAGSLIRRRAMDEMTIEQWQATLELNLSSVFYVTKALLKSLPDGARIVNVSSFAARNGGGPGAFAYAAAKSGVEGLTRGLAKALAPRRIRVNAIQPGTIDTRFHEVFTAPEALEAIRASIPLGRLGTSEDCAELIRFLASPASDFITGEVFALSGGQQLL